MRLRKKSSTIIKNINIKYNIIKKEKDMKKLSVIYKFLIQNFIIFLHPYNILLFSQRKHLG